MLRRLAALVACLLALVSEARAASPDSRIADWAWDRAQAGATAPVLVVLRAKADLSAVGTIPDVIDRRRFVYLALLTTAQSSQAPLLAWLDARGVAHRDFFIVNCVRVEADRALMRQLVQRPEVDRIVGDPTVQLQAPEVTAAPKAAQWDIDIIGAPSVWAEGFFGQGIVVGIQDTGNRWTHQGIHDKYRGWDATTGTASHSYHWHDSVHAGGNGGACGTDSAVPCDDYGHGTHVTGTIAGGDPAGDAFGVAPGAKWIGCRNMDVGNGTPSSYLECFQFFLAPWPIGGDPTMGEPTLAPDVTSNSWVCPPSEGCAWDVLQGAVDAHRAAGIMTVVAAGNSGSGCGSIGDPPSVYDTAYTVGATNSADAMAGFSSRGPAANTGLIKPDIVAPGVGIRSCTADADDSFASSSGTSMATPHVAGAVALLWSARPAYRGRIPETEDLLNRTALRLSSIQEGCGGDDVNGPNNTWGHGRIDLTRALAEACLGPETRCTDAFDDDCDGLIDCADPDCAGDVACPEAGNCADGVDNDRDTLADCADPDCAGDVACPERGNCSDGVDNDLDTRADCADDDCSGNPACPEAGNCTDLVDNDLDTLIDCADNDCAGDLSCPEAGNCTDGVDNDADGPVDCADTDCTGDAACLEQGRCADGADNDHDGSTDCADTDCTGDAACLEQGRCADGADNDYDGFTDCADDDCVGDPACPESAACANARDDDGDGLKDCADPDCAGDAACPEAGNCADTVDNDTDTFTDCADADCVPDAACAGADFDGDGVSNLADCAPLNPGAFGPAGEVTDLRVTRVPATDTALLEWAIPPAGGPGVAHDVATGDLPALHAGGAAGTCLTLDEPGRTVLDARPATAAGAWYLVRAGNACGESPAGWGTDSRGNPSAGCP